MSFPTRASPIVVALPWLRRRCRGGEEEARVKRCAVLSSTHADMGRSAVVHFTPLRNCLANLPLSLHGPLNQRGVAPQSIAVQLSFKHNGQPQQVVLGWTGLPASVAPPVQGSRGTAALAQDRVEMDPQFAAMLNVGLSEGLAVNIELLRDLPHATAVNVTPSTADDWEILETNAEFVEMYLLNQVRAVKEGMMVGCWVGSSLIRFVVDSTSPAASPAVLLTSSTELIVAPKSRHAPAPASSKTHDLSATHSKSSAPTSAAAAEWEHARRRLLRLLPLSLAPPEAAPSTDSSLQDEPASVYVCPSLARVAKKAFPSGSGRFTVAYQARPTGKGSATIDAPPSSDSAGPSGGAASGDAASLGAASAGGSGNEHVLAEVRVVESAKVPAGHVWMSEVLRREIGFKKGDGAFELVRLGAPLSSAARKVRQAQREKDSHAPSSRAASTSKSPAEPSPLTPAPCLAGIDKALTQLRSHIVNSLAARQLSRSAKGSSAAGAPGVLVTGASGAGKTALVKMVAEEMEKDERVLSRTIYVDCSKHADERLPTLKGRMKDWFDEACWHAPAVLVLDNLDRMIAAEVEHADSFPAVHLANTFLSLALPALASRPIVLIATAQGSTSLHPLLSSTHLLGETVSLRGPDKTARRDILNVLVKAKTSSSDLMAPKLNYASIAAVTEGYLPADLRDLVDRAVQQAAIRSMSSPPAPSSSALELTADDFSAAQQGFVPLSLRDVKLQKSEVQWADIGGLTEARKTLRETLEWPTKYGAIFASCPLRLRSGLLLYGYPGCGKTLLASAVAKECGLNFISVKGPEILNKYIGASEKSVRDLFERAQAAKPCILFFDEFDSIAPKRGHDSTGVTDRVVNQMLTQMDGAEGLDGVYVLAATSRPDLIDPALLRPGRLDKSVLCDMPNEQDRLEIMESAARKIHLSSSVSLARYAAQTAGFSGADLQALIYNAHLDAIHATIAPAVDANGQVEGTGAGGMRDEEGGDIKYVVLGGKEDEKVLSRAEQATVNKRLEQIMSAMKEASRSKTKKAAATSASPASRAPTVVEDSHLQKSLQTTRPSVPAEELARLRRIYSEFVSGRSAGGLPSGEASDEVGGRASLM
ncbi:Peroxisome biosynthesis protein PAS1 [Rhodotorula toruloides]|nr:Peroxisome biosynthesis protein PAS1 [Rhodotorula toruloides]